MNSAAEANSVENWNRIWADPKEAEWRQRALQEVYDRIVYLVPDESEVIDLGGGVGTLAQQLIEANDCDAIVIDHSKEAIRYAPKGSIVADLEQDNLPELYCQGNKFLVSTECFEHLSKGARSRFYQRAKNTRGLIVSVPNNRLGPEVEPQHTIKFTALEFLQELRKFFGDDCRVEVIGGFLLGVCGELAKKPFRLSVCFPARDEENDIARTLASFRGVADEIVIGVDYRSKDRTREIACQYADKVFAITDTTGGEDVKVNFAHIRNQCIEHCTGDWVFMTEAHERLLEGQDELLELDKISDHVSVGLVKRTGQGQQWGFPWLFRNDPKIRFTRATHNVLDFPDSYFVVRLPGIATYHERHESNKQARAKQRKVQNRLHLTQDWIQNKNEHSLMYLGSEWATYNPSKAVERLREYLAVNRDNGSQRYHARVQCGKLLAMDGNLSDAREVMMGCTADDWSRVDHWFYLGDIACMQDKVEEGIQFYLYAATRLNDPPFSQWWIDLAIYGYLTAQRLAECYASIGKLPEALHWAERVVELMEDSPADALEDARQNVSVIKEAMSHES
jgi:tetratricopeptide (TPR) repeat protein